MTIRAERSIDLPHIAGGEVMTRRITVTLSHAALAVALMLGTVLASAAEQRHDLHIVIETIPHSHRRYSTVGDWQVTKDGLHITVSAMSDQRYEFLVAAHEMIEAYLALHAGVTQQAADKFDMAYEKRRKHGDDSEPGDDVKAPYYRQHQIATGIERLLAVELGVNWTAYDKEVSSK
jgi:hypothetical protein